MKLLTWAALLFVAPMATACISHSPSAEAAAPRALKVGEQVTMTGRLALKGSMPMIQAVLTRETGERWELTGIPRPTAARLQNKRVTVEGKVVRAAATHMLRPSLAVSSIRLSQ